MRRRGAVSAPSIARRALGRDVTFAVASRVLRFPDEDLFCDLGALSAALGHADGAAAPGLAATLSWLSDTPLLEAQAEYVATFDMKRKCCLYLTYYLNGDTRRRGEALWRFQAALHGAGFEVPGELPDFLPAVLEFAASGAPDVAATLLEEHRAGIHVLAEALAECSSPYEGAVRALDAMLPAWTPETAARAARLIAEGPPTELVGVGALDALDGYGAPSPCSPGVTAPSARQSVSLGRKGRT